MTSTFKVTKQQALKSAPRTIRTHPIRMAKLKKKIESKLEEKRLREAIQAKA